MDDVSGPGPKVRPDAEWTRPVPLPMTNGRSSASMKRTSDEQHCLSDRIRDKDLSRLDVAVSMLGFDRDCLETDQFK